MSTGAVTPGVELLGVRGHERAGARIARRAILGGWPIDDDIRRRVVEKMMGVMENSQEERAQVAAAKVIVAADMVNAKFELAAIESEAPQPGVTVNVGVGVAVEANGHGLATEKPAAIRAAADWIAAMADDARDPGGIRVVRDEGEVCDSPPS